MGISTWTPTGTVGSSRDGHDAPRVSEPEECGIAAFRNLLTAKDEGQRLLSFMAEHGRTFRLLSKDGGLNAVEVAAMAAKCGYLPDFRFNSQVRTFENFPLPSFVDGLIAIKRRGSDDSHWVAWVDGRLISDEGTRLDAVRDVPGFDGYGHRVALWSPSGDAEIIRATAAVPCESAHCGSCFRRGSCHESRI